MFLVAFNIEAVHLAVVVPFTKFGALTSRTLMNLFGANADVVDNNLFTKDFGVNIVDGCNGIYATAVLIAGIIAYPSRFKDKGLGILLGVSAVFLLNQVRVISLFYLGRFFPDLFYEAHVYVWQPIIIVWAIFVWDFWSRKIKEKETQ